MLVDPGNRLVADTLEAEWNDKLRALAQAREERERARQQDQLLLDDAIRQRLVTMTTDFKKLWNHPAMPNRERKRLLAYIIEDATLIKLPAEGVTRIHVRFKGGKTETLTTLNPKSSAQQVKTPPMIVQFVDKLLDDHIYAEIADILNEQELRPGGSARPGRSHTRFTALRVAYLVHRYALRSRYNRLRDRGMLMAAEAATRLGIHEATVVHWAEYGTPTMRTRIFTSCLPLHRPSTAVDGTGSQIEQRLSKQGKNQDLRIQSKEVQCEASYLAQTQSLLPSHTRTFSRLRWPLQNKNRCPLRGSHDKRSRTRPYSPSNPLRMSVTPAAR